MSKTIEFQSLFYWKYLFNKSPICSNRKAIRCFNPCFTGSTSSTFGTIASMSLSIFCFNPCFTGSTSSTRMDSTLIQTAVSVSILVLLEVPLQRFLLDTWIPLNSVSILVLLEVPLQRERRCSNTPDKNIVSILVLLEVPLQPEFRLYSWSKSKWFQSLFYWKYLFNEK